MDFVGTQCRHVQDQMFCEWHVDWLDQLVHGLINWLGTGECSRARTSLKGPLSTLVNDAHGLVH